MYQFEIFTDSSSDLPKDIVERYDLHVMQLEVIINDNPPVLNRDVDIKEFYELLRNGANAKTAAVTPGFFKEEMQACLEEGKDILYLGFASGLSATYANGVMMIEELQKKYSDRKILHIDTISGSCGQGLQVYHAACLREKGASMEEIYEAIKDIAPRVHHQVTVNDLFFLKRGGRLSAATAIAGTMLKVKPIINVDKDGHLNSVGKVRGRKASIKELLERMKSNENVEECKLAFISHSDCMEDAQILETMVKEEYPEVEVVISDIGPVIGAHTGPGALVLCYVGRTVKGM